MYAFEKAWVVLSRAQAIHIIANIIRARNIYMISHIVRATYKVHARVVMRVECASLCELR